jgi:hypothetical protein
MGTTTILTTALQVITTTTTTTTTVTNEVGTITDNATLHKKRPSRILATRATDTTTRRRIAEIHTVSQHF